MKATAITNSAVHFDLCYKFPSLKLPAELWHTKHYIIFLGITDE